MTCQSSTIRNRWSSNWRTPVAAQAEARALARASLRRRKRALPNRPTPTALRRRGPRGRASAWFCRWQKSWIDALIRVISCDARGSLYKHGLSFVRRSQMFIVRQPTQPPSSGGAKCSCGSVGQALRRNMSLLRSWRNILEPIRYKYSVPNGTACVITNLLISFRAKTQRREHRKGVLAANAAYSYQEGLRSVWPASR
jgi:hypothetical protein